MKNDLKILESAKIFKIIDVKFENMYLVKMVH